MIFLVRHGQTRFNLERRLQGRLDSPLTDLGIEQARRMGRVLKDFVVDPTSVSLISSPQGRAVRTAEFIRETVGLGCAVETDERLRELHVGDWEGLTWPEVEARHPDVGQRRNPLFEAPGGEDVSAVAARVGAWIKATDQCDGRLRIVVSHGGSGRMLRHLYAGGAPEDFQFDAGVPQDAVFRLYGGVVGRIDEGWEDEG